MKQTGARIVARTPILAMYFDLVLAVEVRNACLSIGGADRGEDEMHARRPGCVAAGDALSRLACVPPSNGVVIAKRMCTRAPP